MSVPSVEPVTDEGLLCPTCDYNLTGLTSSRCPECGYKIDYAKARALHERERRATGTAWERWPWYLKPAGFVVSAITMALAPWVFARQLRTRPGLLWPVLFGTICLLPIWFVREQERVPWARGAVICLVVQALALWALVPVGRPQARSLSFWLAVCCYASYPLIVEAFWGDPPILLWGESNVWPFSSQSGWRQLEVLPTILFYVWAADIVIIAWVRGRQRQWWRMLLVAISIPISAAAGTYPAAQLIRFR